MRHGRLSPGVLDRHGCPKRNEQSGHDDIAAGCHGRHVGQQDAGIARLPETRLDQFDPSGSGDALRHSALQPDAEDRHGDQAQQRRSAVGVAAGDDRIHAGVLQPLGQRRDQAGCQHDSQRVERRAEAHHPAARGFDRVVVLYRGCHRCGCRHADPEEHPEILEVGHLARPGIKGVGESDQADSEHDDGASSDPVGEHAERPDQQQADELGNPRQTACHCSRPVLVGNAQVLGQDVRLGEIHVREHPDADQGRVHVGPEMHGAHAGRQFDFPDAPSCAAVRYRHECFRMRVAPPSYPDPPVLPDRIWPGSFLPLSATTPGIVLAFSGCRTVLPRPARNPPDSLQIHALWSRFGGGQAGQAIAGRVGFSGAAGGKSGLRRTGRQVTPGGREPTESAAENIPPGARSGTG